MGSKLACLSRCAITMLQPNCTAAQRRTHPPSPRTRKQAKRCTHAGRSASTLCGRMHFTDHKIKLNFHYFKWTVKVNCLVPQVSTPLSCKLISVEITKQFQNIISKTNCVRCLYNHWQFSVLTLQNGILCLPSATLCCKMYNAVLFTVHTPYNQHMHCAGATIGTATGLGLRLYQLVPIRGRPGKNRLKTIIQLPSDGPSTPSVTQNLPPPPK